MQEDKEPYEPPKAMRLDEKELGRGNCDFNGSGDSGQCVGSGNSAGSICNGNGSSPSSCFMSGIGD